MKVLVADKFEDLGIAGLKALGCEVILGPDLKDAALARAVAQSACRVLIVRSTKVTAEIVQAGPSLGLIIRAGAGTDNIDLSAASASSVFVANCPGKNAIAVAELTFGLILALDRRIPDNVSDLRRKVWAKKTYSEARGLKGRTLGVIGVGRIGEVVIDRARAFEMPVMAWSRSLTPDRAAALGAGHAANPEELARGSDIVSVHVAAAEGTRGLVGEKVFAAMKPGSYFINTARAEVVDYAALARAVREKGLRVGLDVFEKEPGGGAGTFDDPFVDLEGVVYGTHHIGASTEQAQLAVAEETVTIVREYMLSGQVRNCVNLSRGAVPEGVLIVRHRNRPGVLAHVLGELSRAGVNVREMENVLCQGEQGACAQIRLDQCPDSALLERIRASHEHIFSIVLTTPGKAPTVARDQPPRQGVLP
jgi:D-3-phosphoglycerate dehydrogenase